MFWVVSYDISDDKRRNQVCAALKNFGSRVQYSVFECELEPQQLTKLRAELARLLDAEGDALRYYRLCKDCLAETVIVGSKPLTADPDYWIV